MYPDLYKLGGMGA